MTIKPTIGPDKAGGRLTSVEYNRDVLQSARYLQEVLAGTNSDKVLATAITNLPQVNILVNGGLEHWDRGAGPFTSSGANVNSAIGWVGLANGGGSLAVSKDTTNADLSGASASVTCTSGASTTEMSLSQALEEYAQINGHTITLTVRVRSTVANAVRLAIEETQAGGALLTYGNYHSGGGGYETLSVSKAIRTGNTRIRVMVAFAVTVSTPTYVDNAMLVYGAQTVDFIPQQAGDSQRRVTRLYQVTRLTFTQYAGSFTAHAIPLPYRSATGGTPTITLAANGVAADLNLSASSAPTATNVTSYGALYQVTPATTGDTRANRDATIEWTP